MEPPYKGQVRVDNNNNIALVETLSSFRGSQCIDTKLSLSLSVHTCTCVSVSLLLFYLLNGWFIYSLEIGIIKMPFSELTCTSTCTCECTVHVHVNVRYMHVHVHVDSVELWEWMRSW